MKNIAKLTLCFSLYFIAIFFISLLMELLAYWVSMVRIIPVEAVPMVNLTDFAWKSANFSIYLTILVSLSYSARKEMASVTSIFIVAILALLYTGGLSIGINRSDYMRLTLQTVNPIQSGPGLVLSRSDSSIILLKDSTQIDGPRVVSFPDQDLLYQENPIGPNNTVLPLPPYQLGSENPWFIRSIDLDLRLGGQEIMNRYNDNYLNFRLYTLSLILLLSSMRFIFNLSKWHLANLFTGALVFRGILSASAFLNTRGVNLLAASFLGDSIPHAAITPIIFCTIAGLIILFTILISIVKPRRHVNA